MPLDIRRRIEIEDMKYILRTSFLVLMVALVSFGSQLNAQNELILNLEDLTANVDGTVELDVTVEDFDEVAAIQFSVYWDSTILDFNSVTNFNADVESLDENSFNEVEEGALLLSWQDAATPRTTEDGEVLFTIVFDVIGEECDEGSLTISDPPDPNLNLEIVKRISGSFMEVEAIVNEGSITINGENCNGGSNVLLRASHETVDPGDQVCVTVEVENFTDVLTMDLTIRFDTTVLEYIEPTNFDLPNLSGNSFNDIGGAIRISWDNNQNVVTRPDGTVIFELCFEAIGASGSSSDITFSNDPIPLEVAREVGGSVETETPDTENGSVEIGGSTFDGLEVVLGDQAVSNNSGFCVPVAVNGFTDITTFSYEINFDETKIQFDSIANLNLDFLNSSSFNTTTADEGKITVVWFDNSSTLEGVTVPDGTVIYEYCFTVIGDCEATEVEVNPDFSGYEAEDVDGEIEIVVRPADIECGFSVGANVTNESCEDACDGEISLDINGGTPDFDIEWSGPTTIPADEMNPTNLCPGTYEVTVTDDNNFSVETSFEVESPNAFSIDNVNITPEITGDDGAIDITVVGSTGNLTFTWDTDPPTNTEDISNIPAGTYNLTITDSETGCEIDTSFVVPLEFSLDINTTDVQCNGDEDGAIDLTVNGGSGEFSYEWSCTDETTQDVSDLPGGDCTVTVTDDNTGFQIERTVSINEPDPIDISSNITMDDGTGSGAIDITPSGGSGGYSYEWSNGETSEDLSNLEVGVYFVTITDDNGCSATFGPLVVTDGSLLVYTLTSKEEFNGSGVSCDGACDAYIEVQAYGGVEEYEIVWDDGNEDFIREDLCPGTYAYTLTDAENETHTETVELPEPAELTVDNLTTDCSDGNDGAVTVDIQGGTEPYMYSWDGINFDTINSNEDLSTGSYTAFVRDANECELMFSYTIGDCTEGDCYEGRPAITPNDDGRNDQLVIRCANDRNNTLQIFDRFGRLVYEEDNYRNTWEGTHNSGNDVNEGSYIWVLEVEFNNGTTEVYKGTVSVLRNLR